MCGIAGFTTFRVRPESHRSVLERMTRALEHRGPDGEGFYQDGRMSIGHRRLAIIDAAGGAQPMGSPDGRLHLAYNGEIYNYLELRKELEAHGEVFLTKSDTEVMLRQFMVDGARALERFDGMFAAALWNRAEESLVLARDRMGEKPLYYTTVAGELVFASELKSLLLFPGVRREINLHAVDTYLAFGYVPSPTTIYQHIFCMEPGTHLRFSADGLQQAAYWDIPLADNPLSPDNVDEMADRLLALLRASVRKRLRSDVPVGVFLSGGIDSSAVTALAAGEIGSKLRTFSIGFPERSYDESPFAREIAERFGTEHHHEILSLRDACSLLPSALVAMDQPFADASVVPTCLLARVTRPHVKTVLGGDGGDELFAGYPSFLAHRVVEALSFLPVAWRDALNRVARRVPVSPRYNSAGHLLRQFLKGAGISPEIRFMLWMGCCSNEERSRILSAGARDQLQHGDPFADVRAHVRNSGLVDEFQRITYLCIKLYLQDDILAKVDRASMAHSLEVRSPFLDHKLVEFACGIPPAYKLRGFTSKYILKRALRDVLPARILDRRKTGFMMPVAGWLRRDMRTLLEDTCSEREIRNGGLFDPSTVRRLIDEHVRNVRDHRKELWALLCFQLWHRTAGSDGIAARRLATADATEVNSDV